MVSSSTPNAPAVGGCLRCHQLFLITDTSAACLICGRPPDLSLPFGQLVPVGEDVEFAPFEAEEGPGEPILIGVTCPVCHHTMTLGITDKEISVVPPPAAPPAEEAAGRGAEPSVEAAPALPSSSEAVEAAAPPSSPAAPPPADTPPPPAMATNVFGQPIEGPPVGASLAAPEVPAE